jgi:hypothetical protein
VNLAELNRARSSPGFGLLYKVQAAFDNFFMTKIFSLIASVAIICCAFTAHALLSDDETAALQKLFTQYKTAKTFGTYVDSLQARLKPNDFTFLKKQTAGISSKVLSRFDLLTDNRVVFR